MTAGAGRAVAAREDPRARRLLDAAEQMFVGR
jgi:hypothetical protein